MTKDVNVECVVCHREYKISSFNPEMYSHPLIKNNFVCILCENKVTKLKVVLSCTKCKKTFNTKILLENRDKYDTKWECPFCTVPDDVRDKRKKSDYLSCDGCKEKKGVCVQPDLLCSYSTKYSVFGGASELYSSKKECTVLSIDKIDMTRDDIHTLKYVMLCNPKYSVATDNVILVKQRVGSKKNFSNKVGLYKFSQNKKRFLLNCEKSYERGNDWIVPTRDKINSILDDNRK